MYSNPTEFWHTPKAVIFPILVRVCTSLFCEVIICIVDFFLIKQEQTLVTPARKTAYWNELKVRIYKM